MTTPKVHIIAGPNGSGKTTFAKEFLPTVAKCELFVNADLIAEGLSPLSPVSVNMKAGRLQLEQIRESLCSAARSPLKQPWLGKLTFVYFEK